MRMNTKVGRVMGENRHTGSFVLLATKKLRLEYYDTKKFSIFFDILLTVRLNIFILILTNLLQ